MTSTSVEPTVPQQSRPEPAPVAVPQERAVTSLPPLASGVPTAVFGFAVIISMLGLANTTLIDSAALFIPAAMVMGTIAIGIGGLYEVRNGDLFGGTFGIAYAGFLLTTGITLRFFGPAADAAPAAVAAFGDAVGSWFLLWAFISVLFTVAARLVNTAALAAFALLALTLLLAGFANIVDGDTATTLAKASGWTALLDGVAAFWLASGLLLNTMYGRDVVPLGAPQAG